MNGKNKDFIDLSETTSETHKKNTTQVLTRKVRAVKTEQPEHKENVSVEIANSENNLDINSDNNLVENGDNIKINSEKFYEDFWATHNPKDLFLKKVKVATI